MLSLTEILHLAFGEVSTIIRDDVVWITKMENNLFEELNRRCCITIANRLRFNPLSEFINRVLPTIHCHNNS